MGDPRGLQESLSGLEESLDVELETLIVGIITAEKRIEGNIHWRSSNRADYASARLRVVCADYPRARLRLVFTVQRTRLPQKATFSLLLGGQRIFSLDVEPRRCHKNRRTLGSVGVTHWHRWPCDEAEPDDRVMTHQEWFGEFLRRSNSVFTGRYRKPPYEPEQLRMF